MCVSEKYGINFEKVWGQIEVQNIMQYVKTYKNYIIILNRWPTLDFCSKNILHPYEKTITGSGFLKTFFALNSD